MTAGIYNFTIEQGASWSLSLTYKDADNQAVDLAGYSAKLQVRSFVGSSEVLLERSTQAGTITLGGVLGTISVEASAAETAALTPGLAVYDLELYSPIDTTIRLLQGDVTISPEVTR